MNWFTKKKAKFYIIIMSVSISLITIIKLFFNFFKGSSFDTMYNETSIKTSEKKEKEILKEVEDKIEVNNNTGLVDLINDFNSRRGNK